MNRTVSAAMPGDQGQLELLGSSGRRLWPAVRCVEPLDKTRLCCPIWAVMRLCMAVPVGRRRGWLSGPTLGNTTINLNAVEHRHADTAAPGG